MASASSVRGRSTGVEAGNAVGSFGVEVLAAVVAVVAGIGEGGRKAVGVGTGVGVAPPPQAARTSIVTRTMPIAEYLDACISLDFPDQIDFPEHVPSWMARTMIRHPGHVNCPPIHSIAPLS